MGSGPLCLLIPTAPPPLSTLQLGKYGGETPNDLISPISTLLMKATAERTAAKAYFFRINEIRNLFCSDNTFTSSIQQTTTKYRRRTDRRYAAIASQTITLSRTSSARPIKTIKETLNKAHRIKHTRSQKTPTLSSQTKRSQLLHKNNRALASL